MMMWECRSVITQPPGKKLQEYGSYGGRKLNNFTFLYLRSRILKPTSPSFCLLDGELEAALDDSNVYKIYKVIINLQRIFSYRDHTSKKN